MKTQSRVSSHKLKHITRSRRVDFAKWWTKEPGSTIKMFSDNDTYGYYATRNGSHGFFFEEPSIISVLKHRGSNYSANIGEVLRVLEDWRSKYNISVVKECERSEYCSGEFRDLILAYNSIHGYVSLLVKFPLYHFTINKTALYLLINIMRVTRK